MIKNMFKLLKENIGTIITIIFFIGSMLILYGARTTEDKIFKDYIKEEITNIKQQTCNNDLRITKVELNIVGIQADIKGIKEDVRETKIDVKEILRMHMKTVLNLRVPFTNEFVNR